YETLRDSIDSFDNLDNIGLAQRLEQYGLLEFRRHAAHLYKKNFRWEESISLSKHNQLYKDAIITAATSASTEICSVTSLISATRNVVEELSWQHDLNDFYMPYKIQVSRTMREKLAALEKEVKERTKKESAKEQQEAEAPIINPANRLMITNGYVSQPPPMANGNGMVGIMPEKLLGRRSAPQLKRLTVNGSH
ncbi:hypothetical protein CY34DRAFT_764410, partial [Suillus luteus UH-Slu-Lm8-n1]